jgi:hypothetical protein
LWKSFGEIEDEHDLDEELIEKELGDDTYIFSARFDVEYLNQTYKLIYLRAILMVHLAVLSSILLTISVKRRSDRDRYLSFYNRRGYK